MKKILFLVLIFPSMLLASENIFKCEKKVKEYFLKNNLISELDFSQWVRMPESKPFERVYRKRIGIGEWIEANINTDGLDSKFYFINEMQTKLVSFDSYCQASVKNISLGVLDKFKNLDSSYFSNLDLKKITLSGKKYIIYVFSPRMIYSLTEMDRAYKIAKKQNAVFVPVFSFEYKPNVEKIRQLAGSLSKSMEFKKQGSLDLFLLQAEEHYPTLFVINNKKMSTKKIQGVMPDKVWSEQIKILFKEI
jgi:hypothetical protein